MKKRLLSLLLIIILLGFVLVEFYGWLISSINKQKTETVEQIQKLKNNLQSLETLSKEQKITPKLLDDLEQQYGSNLAQDFVPPISSQGAAISYNQHVTKKLLEKNKKELSIIENKSFWNYLPAWPVLIFGVVGIIFTRLINLSDAKITFSSLMII